MLGTNGWSSIQSMKNYFKILEQVVKGNTQKRLVVVMDCHPSHIALSTIQWLRKHDWNALLIPAKLTHLLQPLDVCVFRRFKHSLFVEHAKQKARIPSGVESFEDWIETTCECIGKTFGDLDCSSMFSRCGCTPDQTTVSEKVMQFADPSIVRQCRPLSEKELTELIGVYKPTLHKLLFSKPISDDTPQIRPLAKRLKLTLCSNIFPKAESFGSDLGRHKF